MGKTFKVGGSLLKLNGGLNKMEETWKDIIHKDYKNYEISTHGRVRNKKTKKTLKQTDKYGYPAVGLYNNDTKKKGSVHVHRLVCMAFIENIGNKIMVNHIDANKYNNNATNLEWCTAKENVAHAIKNNLINPMKQKIEQYTLDDELIARYDSIRDAEAKTGISNKHISTVCKGKRQTTGGYKWKYQDEYQSISVPKGKVIKDYENYIITEDSRVYSIRSGKYMKARIMGNKMKLDLSNNKNKKMFSIETLFKQHYLAESALDTIIVEKSQCIALGSGTQG